MTLTVAVLEPLVWKYMRIDEHISSDFVDRPRVFVSDPLNVFVGTYECF